MQQQPFSSGSPLPRSVRTCSFPQSACLSHPWRLRRRPGLQQQQVRQGQRASVTKASRSRNGRRWERAAQGPHAAAAGTRPCTAHGLSPPPPPPPPPTCHVAHEGAVLQLADAASHRDGAPHIGCGVLNERAGGEVGGAACRQGGRVGVGWKHGGKRHGWGGAEKAPAGWQAERSRHRTVRQSGVRVAGAQEPLLLSPTTAHCSHSGPALSPE